MIHKHLLPVAVGVALSLGTLIAAEAPAAAPAPVKNLLSDDADKAWKELVDSTRPPLPPAEWNQKKPTDEEFAAFRKKMGEAAGVTADKAKEFGLIDAVFDKRPDAADMEQLGMGSGGAPE